MVIPKGIDFSFILSVRDRGGAPINLECLTHSSHRILKLQDSTVVAGTTTGPNFPYTLDTTVTSSAYSPTNASTIIPGEPYTPVTIPTIPGISGTAPTAGGKLYLEAAAKAYVGNNTVVYGAPNTEIYVIPGASNILFDQNVSTIKLTGKLSSYYFAQQGSMLQIFRDNKLVIQGSTTSPGTNLVFSDMSTTCVWSGTALILGGVTVSSTPTVISVTASTSGTTVPYTPADFIASTKLYLDPNAQAFAGTNTTVYGTLGFEDVYIVPESTNVKFDQNVDRLLFSSPISEYMFLGASGQLAILKNGTVVAQGYITANGLLLTFHDVTIKARITAGIIKVETVTMTSTAVSIVPSVVYTIGGSGNPLNLVGTNNTSTPVTNGKLFLALNEYAYVTSSVTAHGNSGTEGIILSSTAVRVVGDINLEDIVFPLSSSNYQIHQVSTQVVVTKLGVEIFRTSIPANGVNLVFTDGRATVLLVNGVLTINGTSILPPADISANIVCAEEGRLQVTFRAPVTKLLVSRRGDASDYYYLKPTYYYVGVLYFNDGRDPVVATITNIKVIETGV